MYCGGKNRQWGKNGGNCTICGEAWDLPEKLFDKGGKKYLGKITKTYLMNSKIDIKVIVSLIMNITVSY
jgi:hypothetical protein